MLTDHERAVRVKAVLEHCVSLRLAMGDLSEVLAGAFVTIVAASADSPFEAKGIIADFAKKADAEVVRLWLATKAINPDGE